MLNAHYTLFHGSRVQDLKNLSIDYASSRLEFGPAIYCSADRSVAQANAVGGALYLVEAAGPAAGVVNPASTLRRHPGAAQRRLERLVRNFCQPLDVDAPLDEWLFHLKDRVGDRTINHAMVAAGIWLLAGPMHGQSCSGLVDRGIQYRILHDKYILSVTPTN